MVQSHSSIIELKKQQQANVEILRAKVNVILSCTSKFTSKAYVEVSSSLSNAFAMTWASPHNATLQANLVIFCLLCG